MMTAITSVVFYNSYYIYCALAETEGIGHVVKGTDEIVNRIYTRSWSILPQGWIPKPTIPIGSGVRSTPHPNIRVTDMHNVSRHLEYY